MWPSLVLGAGCLLIGCSSERSCNAMACGGLPLALALQDDAGDPVAARGEYRSNTPGSVASAFDCSFERGDASPTPNLQCRDGVILNAIHDVRPGTVVEVRFELNAGGLSDWQNVPLQVTERTDPDFNGPGCPCTWYSGTARAITVPTEARLPSGE
jgi:hypothetical protein